MEKTEKYYPVNVAIAAFVFCVCMSVPAAVVFGQGSRSLSAKDLKMLSVEELMELEVNIVSRSPQKLSDAPSAVQVITGEEIRHSGATNIAEALRLVTNLQVAQLRSNAWIIGSRGFNSLFANKLLVMIDGRSVYTPLFAGVFWDLQNVLLEDVDRIEVVSGPGGNLWGANAVNGVINIVTKNSSETKGLYASILAGSFVKDQAGLRWGGNIGKKISYKVYGQHFDRKPTQWPDGTEFADAWNFTQGGFRIDMEGNSNEKFNFQGDYYGGKIETGGDPSDFNGQNVMASWKKYISDRSDFLVQLYYDRYFKRDAPGQTTDEMETFDVDFQHRFPLAKRHTILWGLGYRNVRDEFESLSPFVAILPERKKLDLADAFIQDDIFISQKWRAIIGTKVLHNVYTGIEFQPSVRLALTIDRQNSVWTSVSRSVRTPSRVDVDYYSPSTLQPSVINVRGGPHFVSEKAVAFELGYRVQPDPKSSFSIATFYTVYDDVYSLEAVPGTLNYEIGNGTEGTTWGAEFAGTYQVFEKWRLRGGYTYFDKKLSAKAGHSFDPSYLGNDVKHQALLQSMMELPFDIHLDIITRYLDYLPATLVTQKVPAYFTFDARIAYRIKYLEFSLVGQNLVEKKHTEFGNLSIPRSVYAKLTLRL
jgi:iron complex outermembrane receptor protein